MEFPGACCHYKYYNKKNIINACICNGGQFGNLREGAGTILHQHVQIVHYALARHACRRHVARSARRRGLTFLLLALTVPSVFFLERHGRLGLVTDGSSSLASSYPSFQIIIYLFFGSKFDHLFYLKIYAE